MISYIIYFNFLELKHANPNLNDAVVLFYLFQYYTLILIIQNEYYFPMQSINRRVVRTWKSTNDQQITCIREKISPSAKTESLFLKKCENQGNAEISIGQLIQILPIT